MKFYAVNPKCEPDKTCITLRLMRRIFGHFFTIAQRLHFVQAQVQFVRRILSMVSIF